MLPGDPVIGGHHFFSPVFIIKDILYIRYHFSGQAAVHLDHIKALGFDILFKDSIAVDQQWLLKVYRLEQGIAEPFISAGIGYKIGGLINLPQGKTII